VKRILLIIGFLVNYNLLYSQNTIDSLFVTIETNLLPSEKLTFLFNYCELNVSKNPNAIKQILNEAKDFMDENNLNHREGDYSYQYATYFATIHNYDSAKSLYYRSLQLVPENNSDLLSKISTKLAAIYREQGLLQQALENVEKAINYNKTSNNNSVFADALIELGAINCELELFDLSLSEYQQAIGYYKEQKDTIKAISGYLSIGKLFYEQENFPMALDYYDKALVLFKKFEHVEGIATTHLYKGQVFEKIGQLQEALISCQLAADNFNLANYKYKTAYVLNQMGSIETKRKHFTESNELLELACTLMKENKDWYGLAESLTNLGDLFFAMEKYSEGIKKNKEALAISEQIASQTMRLKLYEKMATCYYESGDYKMAMNSQTQFHIINRQFTANEFHLKASITEERMDKERKELVAGQAELLRALTREWQIKKIWKSVSVSLLLILFFAFGFYYFWSQKKLAGKEKILSNKLHRINRQQGYLKNLKTQLDELHRTITLYFSITTQSIHEPVRTIRKLVDTKNSSSQATELTPNEPTNESIIMAYNLLENLLYWSRLQLEKLDLDPRNHLIEPLIDAVIQLQHPRALTKNIKCRMHVESGISGYFDYQLIEISMRNLIDNAIKFSTFDSEVIVRAKKEGDTIHISISDNGIGFTRDQLNGIFLVNKNYISQGTHGEKGGGLGLLLAKVFIERNFGTLAIESSIAIGTKVLVVLPCSKNKATIK
jgi:signal transduction histidine kinase